MLKNIFFFTRPPVILALQLLLLLALTACNNAKHDVKIGVSLNQGAAARWAIEKNTMVARAKELGIAIDARLHTDTSVKTQQEECMELIDSGIDVLILTPRNANSVGDIIDYAKRKNVKVISYARIITGRKIDLFVGYDSERIGQRMGKHLSEAAHMGDYILLRGDPNDNNATLLHIGAMRYITALGKNINVILDAHVIKWSPTEAKKMVKAAIAANGNKVDAILAPNDKIAGACAEALAELNVQKYPIITGMDAELAAAQRILAGKQDVTMNLDFKALARTAVDEAYKIALGEKPTINAEFDNQSGAPVSANLITGQLVSKKNLDRILIDGGYYSREQLYGPE